MSNMLGFRLLLICVTLYGVYPKEVLKTDWAQWKLKYSKSYTSFDEELFHKEIWLENAVIVKENNQNNGTFQMELNMFADQVTIFKPIRKGPIHKILNDRDLKDHSSYAYAPTDVPSSWDWRTKGAIGPVMDQGALGDAQAFAAAECVDSYWFIKKGVHVAVSAPEVHDCCTKSPLADPTIFRCIHLLSGLCSAAAYPVSYGKCRNNTCTPVAQVNGGGSVPSGNETAMKTAVYTIPVLALIDASHPSFQLYKSGIYTDPNCSATMTDHALQVVGYGTLNGQDYWICRNSWGVGWGMQGYIYIARNKGNMCGIASYATYPI